MTIPTNVTSIAENSFACSGLTSVTIPGSVTSVGVGAFECCRADGDYGGRAKFVLLQREWSFI